MISLSMIKNIDIVVKIKDINTLDTAEVAFIYDKLSNHNTLSNSSIRKELDKRYIDIKHEDYPEMALALIWFDSIFVGWVGTRPWLENYKNKVTTVQTVECFVNPKFRRMGFAKIGLQSLITASKIKRTDIVSVYAPEVVDLVKQCGCDLVIYCEPDGR